MKIIQDSDIKANDPQISYLIPGWQRICLILKKDFGLYLPEIMPSLLKVVKSLCDAQIQAEENLDVGKNDNDEFTSDEVESALSLLNVLITEVGGKAYYPYFTLTAQLILPLCAFESSEGVRKAAGKTLPSLLDCLKESQQSNPVAITETTKGFLSTLFEQI